MVLDISIIFPCKKKEDIDACAETFCTSFTADAAVWQLAGSSEVGGVDENIICWGFYDAPDRLCFPFNPRKHFWQIRRSEAVVCRIRVGQVHVW